MNAVSYSDLRQNLKTYMDKVYHNHEPLIVTRKNNENIVLISMMSITHYMKHNTF